MVQWSHAELVYSGESVYYTSYDGTVCIHMQTHRVSFCQCVNVNVKNMNLTFYIPIRYGNMMVSSVDVTLFQSGTKIGPKTREASSVGN